MALTKKQQRVLDALIYLIRSGQPPTVREIGDLVGLKSSATVQKHLEALEEEGIIEMTGKSRGLRVLHGAGIPIVGKIAAGEPILSLDETLDEFALGGYEEIFIEPAIFGQSPGADLVALRIVGESMINAGILDGDLAFIRRQESVENGEIAAVIIDGEGTLKRWEGGRGRVRLTPENERFEPIVIRAKDHREIEIYGKFVGLIRSA